jgi:hypothetical protein
MQWVLLPEFTVSNAQEQFVIYYFFGVSGFFHVPALSIDDNNSTW